MTLSSPTEEQIEEAIAWCDKPFAEHLAAASFEVPREATAALDRVFPAPWRREQLLEHGGHAVLGALAHDFGMYRVAHLGLALAELDVAHGTVSKLRRADRFLEPWFELLVGLALRRSGATVEHERHSGHESGADWIATWPSGAKLAVEAKVLNPSEQQRRADALMNAQMAARMQHFTEPHMDHGIQVEIDVPVQAIIDKALAADDDEEAARVVVYFWRPIYSALGRLFARSTEPGTYVLEDLGRVRITPLTSVRGVQTATPAWAQTVDKAIHRLRRPLGKAGNQTKESGLPGVIFLKLVQGTPGGDAGLIREVLLGDEQFDNIAGVFAFTELSCPHEGALVHDQWFDLIAGRAHAALEEDLVRSFRRCAGGHLHFDPLGVAPAPDFCASAWLKT